MAAPDTPALPTAFSSIDGLGAPVALFRPHQRARIVPIACAAASALGALLALAYGVTATATAYSRYGWAVVDQLGSTPAFVFGLFVIGGVIFLAYALATWTSAVALYERGIAFRRLSGVRAWAWADLAALYISVTHETGIFRRTRHRYTLEHISGERFSFGDRLENAAQLGALVGRQIVDRHYPQIAAQFNAGEPVHFGAISLDQNQIQVKGQLVRWNEVETVSVRRGYLEVRARNGMGAGVSTAAIPNLDVLLLLLDHVTELRLEE